MNSVWQKVGEVFSALYFGSNNILYSPQSIQNRSYTFRLAVRVFCNKSTPSVYKGAKIYFESANARSSNKRKRERKVKGKKKREMYSQYYSSMPHTPWESRRRKQRSEIKLPLCYNAALSCPHWQISFLIPCRTERHSQQTPNYRHTLLSGVQFLTQRDYKRISLSIFFPVKFSGSCA